MEFAKPLFLKLSLTSSGMRVIFPFLQINQCMRPDMSCWVNSTRKPEMVRKEILMHLIVYNCIRTFISEAAERDDLKVRRISFKGALQAMRKWEPYLKQVDMTPRERNRLIQMLYRAIADDIIASRPGRNEPRAVKRRPKNYQRFNKPRHEMNVCPHRSKYRAENA